LPDAISRLYQGGIKAVSKNVLEVARLARASTHTPPRPLTQAKRRPKGEQALGTVVPDNWEPAARSIARGRRRGLTDLEIFETADKMRAWSRANAPRAVARKTDWDESFDNFIINAAQAKRERGEMNGHARQNGSANNQGRGKPAQTSPSNAIAKSAKRGADGLPILFDRTAALSCGEH
jgi:hypothetical protein